MSIRSCILAASILGATALLTVWPASTWAINQFQKFTPNDININDNFGYSVGISGSNAIIGSWQDDRPNISGDDSGSAYIFRDNGTGNWAQLDKLTASDSARGNAFGSAVAIDGNTAVVGAVNKSMKAGGAYIFRDNGAGDWLQVDTLAAGDAATGDEFGYSVAVNGNTAIVGAWQKNAARGAAYIYRDNGAGDWAQVGTLTAGDAMPSDHFGISVAISGTTALVGADFDTNTSGPIVGAVYVFEESGGAWSQVDKLIASDAALGNRFGTSIALAGNMAVIGAPGDGTAGAESGAAYIYWRDGALGWQEVQKLLPGDSAQGELFGHSVGFGNGAAIVGAYQSDDGGLASGSAYFFRENSLGGWHQVAKLLASDDDDGDALGYSVATSGGVGLVGAPLNNPGGTDAGAAYLFRVPTGVIGDYNRNGTVDVADFAIWRNTSGQAGLDQPADGNGDGLVNQADYNLWRANFGLSAPPGPQVASLATVPEPASAVLLLLFISYVGWVRREARTHRSKI